MKSNEHADLPLLEDRVAKVSKSTQLNWSSFFVALSSLSEVCWLAKVTSWDIAWWHSTRVHSFQEKGAEYQSSPQVSLPKDLKRYGITWDLFFCGAEYSRVLLYACSGSVFLGRFIRSKRNSHMVAESCEVKWDESYVIISKQCQRSQTKKMLPTSRFAMDMFFHSWNTWVGWWVGCTATPLLQDLERQSSDWQFGQFRILWYSNPRMA